MSSAYWNQPVSDQATAIHEGVVTAETLVGQTRAEVTRAESDLAAWVALSDHVIDDARLEDETGGRRPLRGISIGVKDLIDVAGLPTRAGSTVTSAEPAVKDADCVARFRELGAVIQGKTVTTEFGYFSPGPTRNPAASDHTPGGSSSGSAAAVGAGVIPIALGTQTAGSLTRPASYCGAVGMVLAQGTTSLAGVTGLSESLDSLGILTRTVDDMAYVYSAFTGRPQRDPDRRRVSSALVWRGSDLDTVEPSMRQLLDLLPDLLAQAGIEAQDLDWDDHIRTLADDHVTVMSHEAAATLDEVEKASRDALSPQLCALIDSGRDVPAPASAGALIRRDRSRALLREMLGDATVVVGPAALGPAPKGLDATGSPILSRPWQLLGLPVVVVPGARTTDGLPLGLQVIGMPGDEANLFEAAGRLEPLLHDLPAIPA
ncbi:amidase [Gordonia sp. CPCC 205515]|uniref:amidase n=1 Tax=Gordonia sp. CPCC 205515 TaxID=3140791 RepID=UPI003AF392C9